MATKLREQRAEKICRALRESKGLLTLAAQKAGVSYWTVWRYSKDFPSVAKAVEESKEGMLDFAEGKLYKAISEDNLTAIIFFLKTKGKQRGYIERSELSGLGGGPIKQETEVKYAKFDANEVIKAIAEAIQLGLNPSMGGGDGHNTDASLLPAQTDI